MGFFAQISDLLSFVLRWSRGIRFGRSRIFVIIATGIISGLANAGLVAVINTSFSAGDAMFWPFIGLCIALPVSRLVSGVLLTQLTATAVYHMRLQLSRQIITAPLRKLEELGPSKLLATLTSDVPAIVGALSYLPMLLMQIFIILGSLAYLAWLSWTAFLGTLAFMAVGLVTYQIPISRANRYVTAARDSIDLLMKGLRALTEGTKELKLHHKRRDSFFSDVLEPAAGEMRRYRTLSEGIFVGAASWGHALFFVLVGLLIFGLPKLQPVSTEVLSGYTLAILYMITPLLGILESLPTMANAVVGVEKIERLGLSLEAEGSERLQLPAETAPTPDWGSLELQGVTHTYHLESEDRSFTLGPIDLTIRP
ncbi:MAG: ABC transporter ATP-binding protein, partial [Acidobacteria bacterium]|nr:ABC transporter ATP-binding protein [Acidobacteriota bacterium]